MAITYPRLFPIFQFEESTFTLDSGIVESRHSKGRVGTLSRVREPLWFARFNTGQIHRLLKTRWQSWFTSLNGINDCLTYDHSKKELINYPNGVPQIIANTWNGTASVASLATPNQVNLVGLPSGIVFKDGDRLGLTQNNRYGYYQIIEDATSSAGTVNLTVAPRINTSLFTTSAIAVCYRPLIRLRIRSFDLSFDSGDSPITIEGVQVL